MYCLKLITFEGKSIFFHCIFPKKTPRKVGIGMDPKRYQGTCPDGLLFSIQSPRVMGTPREILGKMRLRLSQGAKLGNPN